MAILDAPKARRACCAVALALACTALPARAQHRQITISTDNTPLDRALLQAVSQEAFRRLGLEFRLANLPSERSLLAADLGEVDGEGLRVAGLDEQFPHLIRVPERYVSISFVAFAIDPKIVLGQGWESLKPYRVAYINGWKMFEANASTARVVHRVDKPEQLFRMLESRRVDLALYTYLDGRALTRKLGLSGVAPLSPPLKVADLFLYLNRKHEALVPQLAQTLRDMKVDGSYGRIVQAVGADAPGDGNSMVSGDQRR